MTLSYREEYYKANDEEYTPLEANVVNHILFMPMCKVLHQVLERVQDNSQGSALPSGESFEPIPLEVYARKEKPVKSRFLKYQSLHLQAFRAMQGFERRLEEVIGRQSLTRADVERDQLHYKSLLRQQFVEFMQGPLPKAALQIPEGTSTRRHSRGYLPRSSTRVLRKWLFGHFHHPYPSQDEKEELAIQTGLKPSQVNYWFINARVRIWKPMLSSLQS